MFIILSGPSGVGKSTVLKELMQRNKDKGFKFLSTYTTRPKEREEESSNYIHITKEDMENKIKNNELFECEEIHGNFYATTNEQVSKLKNSKDVFFKDLGVLGKENFCKKLKDVKIITFFLDMPDDVLLQRLIGRGEKNIEKRMERYSFEREHSSSYDHIIYNDNLEKTIQTIQTIIYDNL